VLVDGVLVVGVVFHLTRKRPERGVMPASTPVSCISESVRPTFFSCDRMSRNSASISPDTKSCADTCCMDARIQLASSTLSVALTVTARLNKSTIHSGLWAPGGSRRGDMNSTPSSRYTPCLILMAPTVDRSLVQSPWVPSRFSRKVIAKCLTVRTVRKYASIRAADHPCRSQAPPLLPPEGRFPECPSASCIRYGARCGGCEKFVCGRKRIHVRLFVMGKMVQVAQGSGTRDDTFRPHDALAVAQRTDAVLDIGSILKSVLSDENMPFRTVFRITSTTCFLFLRKYGLVTELSKW